MAGSRCSTATPRAIRCETTNVRIGRHRDNDICLQNDSISRRHALLHFNADNRRFVITDLGGDNGVIVNKIKQQIARVERWRPSGARRGPAALPRQHGARIAGCLHPVVNPVRAERGVRGRHRSGAGPRRQQKGYMVMSSDRQRTIPATVTPTTIEEKKTRFVPRPDICRSAPPPPAAPRAPRSRCGTQSVGAGPAHRQPGHARQEQPPAGGGVQEATPTKRMAIGAKTAIDPRRGRPRPSRLPWLGGGGEGPGPRQPSARSMSA